MSSELEDSYPAEVVCKSEPGPTATFDLQLTSGSTSDREPGGSQNQMIERPELSIERGETGAILGIHCFTVCSWSE
jgi:hypothetical protein